MRPLRSLRILALAAGLVALGAHAQAPGSDARMQKERATCDGVQQDRAACLREAGAARQEAGRNGLTSASPGGYDANALARCREQPVADRSPVWAPRWRLLGSRPSVSSGKMGSGYGPAGRAWCSRAAKSFRCPTGTVRPVVGTLPVSWRA